MKQILFCLICLTTAFFANGACAATDLTADQKQMLTDIEKYFNGLKTIRSDFYQVSSTGMTAEGKFYVSKPNKMRLEYAPPHPVEVIADGYYLIFHDKKLDQVTHLDLEDNPASFILKENLSFEKENITIEDVSRDAGVIIVSLYKKNQPAAGKITLVFKEKPFALKQWQVVDAQQIVTLVTLNNVETGVDLDPSLFKLKKKKKGF